MDGDSSEPQYALTEQQLESYRDTFRTFDAQNTGFCSFSRDWISMFRVINQNPTEADLAAVVEDFDKDKSDKFDMDKWLRICEGPHFKDFTRDDHLLEAFRQMDKDSTGKISVAQFRYMLQVIGEPLAPEQADELVDFAVGAADKEKTGEIEYEALVKAVLERDPGIAASI